MITFRDPRRIVATLIVLCFAALTPVLRAQDEDVAEAPLEDTAQTVDDFRSAVATDILFEEEEMLAGGEPTYDPAGRRDPFRSLLSARDSDARGPRPEGVPGLVIGEIDLNGVFLTEGGPVAQVYSSAEDKSYLLHPGDELFDGDVVSVTLEEIVFKQIVDDPTALKPFREVVKRLNP